MTKPKLLHRRISRYFLLIQAMAFLSVHAQCQENESKHHFLMYISAPSMTSISSEKAADLGIGETAWTMELGVQTKIRGWLGISGALGYGGTHDDNSFSQNTTWGELESSFSILSYDFKAGVWMPERKLFKNLNLNFSAGISAGYEGYSGRREIVNCEDCNVEKYSFEGGAFIEPEISFFFYRDLIGVGTSYRYFIGSADLKGNWSILKLMCRLDRLNR